LLGQYFEEYGIETYRFFDFAVGTFINVILLFIIFTLFMAGLTYLYLKFKKKDTSVLIYANGFVRIYLEILLDGILYVSVNLRSLKFIGFLDAFSYLLLIAFALIVILFTLFLISYSK